MKHTHAYQSYYCIYCSTGYIVINFRCVITKYLDLTSLSQRIFPDVYVQFSNYKWQDLLLFENVDDGRKTETCSVTTFNKYQRWKRRINFGYYRSVVWVQIKRIPYGALMCTHLVSICSWKHSLAHASFVIISILITIIPWRRRLWNGESLPTQRAIDIRKNS